MYFRTLFGMRRLMAASGLVMLHRGQACGGWLGASVSEQPDWKVTP
jgi:hypothetical protein